MKKLHCETAEAVLLIFSEESELAGKEGKLQCSPLDVSG
jgi:hypothetical protein